MRDIYYPAGQPLFTIFGLPAARADSYLRLERLRSLRTSQRRAPPATARLGVTWSDRRDRKSD
jgi:hypothetical protein